MKGVKRSPSAILAYRAEKAFKRAVAKAIAEHRRNGVPIAILRDGKVVRIPPDQIMVRDVHTEYGKSSPTFARRRKRER